MAPAQAERERKKKTTTVPGRVGHAMVGRTIEVYWAADAEWQEGRVLNYNIETGKHTVEYTQQGGIHEQLTLACVDGG